MVFKQKVVKFVTTKHGGGRMQSMMLLKKNDVNWSSGN